MTELGLADTVGILRQPGVRTRYSSSGLGWERLALLGMEYRQVASHLRGEKSLADMTGDLLRDIHQLAKRQETYFRGMERRGLPVQWIGPDVDAAELERRHDLWKSRGYPRPA